MKSSSSPMKSHETPWSSIRFPHSHSSMDWFQGNLPETMDFPWNMGLSGVSCNFSHQSMVNGIYNGYIYIFHENEVSRPSSMFLCTATNRLEIMSQARGRIVAAPQVHRRTCGFLGETWRFHQEFNGRVGVVWEYHGYIIQLYITNHQYIYI